MKRNRRLICRKLSDTCFEHFIQVQGGLTITLVTKNYIRFEVNWEGNKIRENAS